MFLWTRKSGCWMRSAIPSMSLSNTLKYKIYINLLLIDDNLEELNDRIVLLIEVPWELSIQPHLSMILDKIFGKK